MPITQVMAVPATAAACATPLPLVWCGALRDPSGYADEARAFLVSLERAGYAAIAKEMRYTQLDAGISGEQLEAIERACARGRKGAEGPLATVFHMVPHPAQPLADAGPSIARTMFETDRVPVIFRDRCFAVDEVWVPSQFNVETFQRGGVPGSSLHVLPGSLDFALFTPGAEPLEIAGRRGFTFLSTFDFTDRKGWDVLLEAWAAAFDADDDVCLVLKCLAQNGTTVAQVERRIAAFLGGRRTAPIVLNTEVLSAAALPRLYATADAFVLASRGEGWGRPYMEAMAMGLPTIGSRWSANLEFMNDGNSLLVDGRVVDVPESAQLHAGSLYRGQRWFDPDVDALAQALRTVAAGGDLVAARARGARAELIERFGPEPVSRRLAELTGGALERWQWRRSRPTACVWRGEWGSVHSLAVVNDGVADALEAAGSPVARALPDGTWSADSAVGVAGHWPPSFEAPSEGPFVLYQPFEFGAVPARWVEEIRNRVDEVWTPSEAARQGYLASGVAPELVHVVPNGVDLERFSPEGPRWPLPTTRGTVFLFVGGTIYRKGIDVLLEAYGRAFTDADDVCLVVKGLGASTIYAGQTAERQLEAFRARPDAPELVTLEDELPFAQLGSLYRAADVLVQPYRGEGFCLPALEALACGVPVIVTAGGPTDEFAPEACAWHVAAERRRLATTAFEEPLAVDGFLLEPDVDSLVAALREAADPDARARRAARAREHALRFSWTGAAERAAQRIAALAGRTPVRTLPAAEVPGRRRVLFAVEADWAKPESWAPAVHAYAAAFGPGDDTTLVLTATDEERAVALVTAELESAGIDLASLADVAVADPRTLPRESLELAADAVITSPASRPPTRARRQLPPDPTALRAVAES